MGEDSIDLVDMIVEILSPIEDTFEEMEVEYPVSNETLEDRVQRLLAQRRERERVARRELIRQASRPPDNIGLERTSAAPHPSGNIFAAGLPPRPLLPRTSRYIPRPTPVNLSRVYYSAPRVRRRETDMLGTPRGITRRRLSRGNGQMGGKTRRKSRRKYKK